MPTRLASRVDVGILMKLKNPVMTRKFNRNVSLGEGLKRGNFRELDGTWLVGI